MSGPGSTVLNRALLGAVGLVLSLFGAGPLASASPWPVSLPAWWPLSAPDAPLVGTDGPARLLAREWWPYAVAAASAVMIAGCLLWWAGTLRRGTRSRVPLTHADTALRVRALSRAVTREVAAVDGVASCRTRVTGRRLRLRLRIDVTLRPGGTPEAVLPALDSVVARTELLLVPRTVRAEVRFRGRPAAAPRLR
ncbi:hypothetical protein [Streptomyces sp. NPDC090093]|uniref:hypothetical protein n=1 Tax=Streptomyces sp. NPDC090093 TaxID=3365945 RepID=UPI0037F172DF